MMKQELEYEDRIVGRKRQVEKTLSVFDLKIRRALSLRDVISTRVMFIYDKKTDKREFKVLDSGKSEEMNIRICDWLKDNVADHSVFLNLNANQIDADRMDNPLIS